MQAGRPSNYSSWQGHAIISGACYPAEGRLAEALYATAQVVCAEHVRQLGGESPLHNLMEVK